MFHKIVDCHISQLWKRSIDCEKDDIIVALKECSRSKDLERGKKVHWRANKSGHGSKIAVANTLIDMYAKCGSMVDARAIFDNMPQHSMVSWTALLNGYVESGEDQTVLQLFTPMMQEGCQLDAAPFVTVLRACSNMASKDGKSVTKYLHEGINVHSEATKRGCDSDAFLACTLVDMYAKCGSMQNARTTFDNMLGPSVVSYTSLIFGYVRNGESRLALQLFENMISNGCNPDGRTFLAAIKACINLATEEVDKDADKMKQNCLQKSIAIHLEIVKSGHQLDIFVACALIDVYASCGSMIRARDVFDRMLRHTVVSWTALIMGYVENGEGELSLELFQRMQSKSCQPDALTYVAVLKACGGVASLETGRMIHADICRRRFQSNEVLTNCLIDFYAKCGSMAEAQKVFDSIVTANLIHWSTLIAGYGRHGNVQQVFDTFQRMQEEKCQADGVTFLSLLTACSHAGLVDKGKDCLDTMHLKYGVLPNIQHYHCLVDMLGRAERLDEAVALVKSMPFEADIVSWTMILAACRKSKNVTVGKLAFDSVLKIDEKQDLVYPMMASIYGSAGMWEEKSKIIGMGCRVLPR